MTMTGAGATYPYKNDPADSNIRIAPTLPPLEELDQAMKVFVACVKLAAVESCWRIKQTEKVAGKQAQGKTFESPLLLLKGLASCGSFFA